MDEFKVPIYLMTGFLESGKTSFLNFTLAQEYFQIDEPTLLILCEEGEEEYDKKVLKKSRTSVEVIDSIEMGSTSRFTRGNILAQLGEQYIVVANAKGLSQRAVMVGHAFRNSLVPIITLIGNYFGGILGGSTIIENIFAIPGLGSYVLSAIQNRDYPVIQGYVLITGTTFVLVTLAIDLLYIAVNPKIRLQGGEA